MEWRPLSFQDKDLIETHFKKYPIPLSDYTFTNLWMWNGMRCYHFTFYETFLCLKYKEHNQQIYLYPIGKDNPETLIYEFARENEESLYMRAIPEDTSLLFSLNPEPAHFNYIYAYDDLLHLAGNAYQAKRNLIHQFNDLYDYQYQPITKSLIPKICAMQKKWIENHSQAQNEHFAILRALMDYEHLNLVGGSLIIEGQVIAYSFAEYLPNDILVVHAEKALLDYKGSYQMINQELLKHINPVKYINREQDLGLSNLRKIKQSYHPIRLEKSFSLHLSK